MRQGPKVVMQFLSHLAECKTCEREDSNNRSLMFSHIGLVLLWSECFPQCLIPAKGHNWLSGFQWACSLIDECAVSNNLNTRDDRYRRHAMLGQRFQCFRATGVYGWLCSFVMKRQHNYPHAQM